MKLFSKTAYHSTSRKGMKQFEDKTSDKNAYKGEGAMIHGWGLYLQADKQLNIDNYKDDLSTSYLEMDFGQGMHNWGWYHNEKKSLGYYGEDQELRYLYVAVEHLWDRISDDYDYLTDEELNREVIDLINSDDTLGKLANVYKGVRVVRPEISQYEVEIPDDMVFIEENEKISTNPYSDKLVKLFYDIRKKYGWEGIEWNPDTPDVFNEMIENTEINYDIDFTKHENELENIFDGIIKELENYTSMPDIYYYLDSSLRKFIHNEPVKRIILNEFASWFGVFDGYVENLKGYDYYKSISQHYGNSFNNNMPHESEISNILCENGIGGIHYNGNTDGSCWVIFDCSKLKIVSEE